MTEATLQRKIQAALKELRVWVVKMHGGRYMPAGLPDLLAIYGGRVAWLEVKRPGEKASPIQRARHAELRGAGAPVAVVESVDEAVRFVREALL